jgi:hypothetical protein
MSTAENGGLLRRLPRFSILYLRSSFTFHFQISLHSFSSISCSFHKHYQENRRESIFSPDSSGGHPRWPMRQLLTTTWKKRERPRRSTSSGASVVTRPNKLVQRRKKLVEEAPSAVALAIFDVSLFYVADLIRRRRLPAWQDIWQSSQFF